MCPSTINLLVSVGFVLVGWPAVAQITHPRVCTDDGCLLGTSMTDMKNLKFEAFVGIPYAKPPVGKLRFKKPVPVEPWTQDYNATESKPACMQKSFLQPGQPIIGEEDCLFLNVYRPKSIDTDEQPLPVMVFIHGGGYFSGSADPQLYGPERILATRRVILVTFQYRLGVFGFLSTGDCHASGNYGMLDQVLALRWVQRHIQAFGGNPAAVTLFGESAGGASVQLHMMSPLSRGLFQRAIIMSGSAMAVWSMPIKDPLALTRKQAKLVGISEADELTTAELVDVLQYLDAKVLVASTAFLRTWFEHPIILYRPTVQGPDVPKDERFLSDDPWKLWEEGAYVDVPLMIGAVPNEGAVVSLAILYNDTALSQFNENLAGLLPTVMAINATDEVLTKLQERYFPENHTMWSINEKNADQFTQMITDAFMLYPMASTVQQYLNKTADSCHETDFYSFEFNGQYSFSTFYANSNVSHGVCHQDELLYLFRMVDLFPDFPPNSTEEKMAEIWTDYFVKFATERDSEAPKQPCEGRIRSVTFEDEAPFPDESTRSISKTIIDIGLHSGFEELREFWSDIYRPQPNEPWQGNYDASKQKPACMQQLVLVPSGPVHGSEDCLYLNVFTPILAPGNSGPLPVMVYIHGGAYQFGSAQVEQHDPARIMASRRVIVVTLQYRLGVLGFLATGDLAAPGNAGMKDQSLALRWVHRNIRAFGGDPRRVTIIGESSAGASVQLHMMSPLSHGLFQRAISMSGSALAVWSVPIEDPLALARRHAHIVGVPNADRLSTVDLIRQLRNVDALNLTAAGSRLKVWDVHPLTLYHPVTEPEDEPDPFLAEDPRSAWRRGAVSDHVPWLTGSIPNDGSIVSQTIYRDPAVIADLDTKFVQLIPVMLRTNVTMDKLDRLRRRFLKGTPAGRWITKDNYASITRMLSEAWFKYPLVKSLKQRLALRRSIATSVYSFQFQGRYSLSQLLTGRSYGLSHADDTLYLFRKGAPFPELPTGSAEAEMAQLWVKFLVDFAVKGYVEWEGTCDSERLCQSVTYANTNNTYFPIVRTLTPGLDEELYGFWKQIYEETD
ncbi:uncharacterized protein LOC128724715 [Anopheles nili]|uniref:uncharacterized protein LOC128724715 n=1 Tax=Anopheles nili TaxID=185578 RepID=UPI00237A7652|nr:uncharacterized protein LOC128724715 [Anopheles nili]